MRHNISESVFKSFEKQLFINRGDNGSIIPTQGLYQSRRDNSIQVLFLATVHS